MIESDLELAYRVDTAEDSTVCQVSGCRAVSLRFGRYTNFLDTIDIFEANMRQCRGVDRQY